MSASPLDTLLRTVIQAAIDREHVGTIRERNECDSREAEALAAIRDLFTAQSSETFTARLSHVEFANRIAMALGLYAGDEHPFDSLVERVQRLREIAALTHPNELRLRNDKLAGNNNALNARATKAEAESARLRAERDEARESLMRAQEDATLATHRASTHRVGP